MTAQKDAPPFNFSVRQKIEMIHGTGIALGIFGLGSLALTGFLISCGEFKSLNRFDYIISVIGSVIRNTLLITSGVMVYYAPDISGIFVWAALCVFIIGALAVVYKEKKKVAFADFVPSFYYTCLGLLVGAIILT